MCRSITLFKKVLCRVPIYYICTNLGSKSGYYFWFCFCFPFLFFFCFSDVLYLVMEFRYIHSLSVLNIKCTVHCYIWEILSSQSQLSIYISRKYSLLLALWPLGRWLNSTKLQKLVVIKKIIFFKHTLISSLEDAHVDSNMCYSIIPYTFLVEVTLHLNEIA